MASMALFEPFSGTLRSLKIPLSSTRTDSISLCGRYCFISSMKLLMMDEKPMPLPESLEIMIGISDSGKRLLFP